MRVQITNHDKFNIMAEETPLTEASLPSTAAKGRFKGKVAIVTGGASGKL